jgi:hypothetical protein
MAVGDGDGDGVTAATGRSASPSAFSASTRGSASGCVAPAAAEQVGLLRVGGHDGLPAWITWHAVGNLTEKEMRWVRKEDGRDEGGEGVKEVKGLRKMKKMVKMKKMKEMMKMKIGKKCAWA